MESSAVASMEKIFSGTSKLALLITLTGVLALTGCANRTSTFYWGDYEQLIYDMYIEPGSADATTQIQKLTETIEEAQANGQSIAPGIHAHLGYMYALQGNTAQSISEFQIEKSLFPESSVLIDGMMNRLKGAKP